MAKKGGKIDKVVNDLAKEVKKLRKQNERLAEALEGAREDQAASHREMVALLDERLPARDAGPEEPAEDAPRAAGVAGAAGADGDGPSDGPTDENAVGSSEASSAEPVLAEAPDAGEGETEITLAAKRRAEELGVDPSKVEGTGAGGRILVKDVEAAAEGEGR